MNSQSIHKKRVSNPKGKVHLGLCCINNSLRKYKPEGSRKNVEVFCSRSTPRRTFTVERAKKMALDNIADIAKLVDWNIKNNIHHLRLSSEIFPLLFV